MRRALLVAAVAALAVPAAAFAQEPPAKRSEAVSYLRTLTEPGVISARFRDGLMYVSSEGGLTIFDVRAPEQPREIGRLRLPNFENEDIDLGGDVALISNDPSEGVGRLHVISIADPTAPELITSFDTGTADGGILSRPLGESFGMGWGTGHTASCVDECRWVYLAGTGSGLDIVDLRDPAKPAYAGNFPAAEATGGLVTHDVQFDRRGLAWVAGAGGVAAYDVGDPLHPRLVHHTDEQGQSRYAQTFGTDDGSTLNDYIHHNSVRLGNSDLAELPPGADPAADSDVVAITEEDYNRPACQGAGSFHTWAITSEADGAGKGATLVRNLDRWDVEVDPSRQSLCSAHYFDVRGGLVAQGWYEQGTRFLDVSDPRDIRQVGYWIPNKTLTWGALYPPTDPTGEVVYALDNARGIDVLRIDRPEPGEPPLPTVVAPPGEAPGGPGPGSSPGRGAGVRPNVRVTVTDRRARARRGSLLRYRLAVRQVAGPAARDLRVTLTLPRGLRRGRTRVVRRLRTLRPRTRRTWLVTARVPRRTRRRVLLAQARLTAADDANPRDDRAVDRTRLGRARRVRGAVAAYASLDRSPATPAERSRAAADQRLAHDLALLPPVRAAPRGRARALPTLRSAYGWVCRVRAR